jgi:sortase B
MKDGSMFASITKFQDQAYYEKHKTIQYDTIYGDGSYKIFAAFSLDVGHITDLVRILYFSPNKNKTDFDHFVKMMQENSLIDTGLTPEYGDRLLTLSTCEYTHSAGNGRFVVLAYKE